uniref:Uncharacterized protein n=1 Tax=Brachypodium sylvaticum TaxID=29664 RepID=C3TX66_BRASY|nr:hypothetical protein [Brachypodium sylvaticum]
MDGENSTSAAHLGVRGADRVARASPWSPGHELTGEGRFRSSLEGPAQELAGCCRSTWKQRFLRGALGVEQIGVGGSRTGGWRCRRRKSRMRGDQTYGPWEAGRYRRGYIHRPEEGGASREERWRCHGRKEKRRNQRRWKRKKKKTLRPPSIPLRLRARA